MDLALTFIVMIELKIHESLRKLLAQSILHVSVAEASGVHATSCQSRCNGASHQPMKALGTLANIHIVGSAWSAVCKNLLRNPTVRAAVLTWGVVIPFASKAGIASPRPIRSSH